MSPAGCPLGERTSALSVGSSPPGVGEVREGGKPWMDTAKTMKEFTLPKLAWLKMNKPLGPEIGFDT